MFDRKALGGDLEANFALNERLSFQLFGELYWGTNLDRGNQVANPISAGRDLRELGYVGGVTFNYQRLFAGVRYDLYNPDRDSSEVRDGTQVVRSNQVTTLAYALGTRVGDYGRVIAEYDHNTNNLGRSATGQPTLLPDDAFTVRAEVGF
jgi:hypothetical protein